MELIEPRYFSMNSNDGWMSETENFPENRLDARPLSITLAQLTESSPHLNEHM